MRFCFVRTSYLGKGTRNGDGVQFYRSTTDDTFYIISKKNSFHEAKIKNYIPVRWNKEYKYEGEWNQFL